MSIKVYWSVLEKEWMRAREPQSVAKNFYGRKLHDETPNMSFHRCPFTHNHLSNIYTLHSLYDYSFAIENGEVVSRLYDQKFFNDHVIVRSIDKKCFSFTQGFVFFTEEKSLEMQAPLFPHLEDNNITKRCMQFEGTLDIGKYFRNIDFAFFLKEPYNDFVIEQDEIFGYVRFNTKEKIELVQFAPSQKLYEYYEHVKNAPNNKKNSFSPPDYFYNNFKIKKNILKEIKNNIVD